MKTGNVCPRSSYFVLSAWSSDVPYFVAHLICNKDIVLWRVCPSFKIWFGFCEADKGKREPSIAEDHFEHFDQGLSTWKDGCEPLDWG